MDTDANLVALLGSPRKGGNTEILLNSTLEAARESGATVKMFRLSSMKITPCIGCRKCDTNGTCVIRDQMQEIYAAVDEATSIVIASPVYFYSVSAWAKAAMDRFQVYWARTHILKQPKPSNRYGAVIAVGATGGRRLFEGNILTARYCFMDAGFEYSGHVLVRNTDNIGDVLSNPTHLKAAAQLGTMLVEDPSRGYRYVG